MFFFIPFKQLEESRYFLQTLINVDFNCCQGLLEVVLGTISLL